MFIPRSRFCIQECTHLYAHICCGNILACQSLAISKQWEAYDHRFRYCLSPFLSLLKSLVTSREERISFHLKNNHFLSYSQKQVVVTECVCVCTRVCVYPSAYIIILKIHYSMEIDGRFSHTMPSGFMLNHDKPD